MQLVSNQLAFVLHAPFVFSILHRCNQGEAIRAAGTFLNQVVKLRDADGSGDTRSFLFQIEVRAAKGAVCVLGLHQPVAGEIGAALLRGNERES